MGCEFWSRLLAIASFAGTALISAWLIEYGLSEASNDRAYFVIAPLLPLLFGALGVAGTVGRGRAGEILAWSGALLLTLFFAAPGMIGPLYAPAALLVLISAVLVRRASSTRAIASL
jgi:peptidoglycan/LPS O-acetylase OafA/YrhL